MKPMNTHIPFSAALTAALTLSCVSGSTSQRASSLELNTKSDEETRTVLLTDELPDPTGAEKSGPNSGMLDASDMNIGDLLPQYSETWTIDCVAGEMLTVDVQSSEFDTFVVVLYVDGDGNVWTIAEDDDGGDGFNSRVSFEAVVDGEYEIWCTSAYAEQTGAYSLEVTTHGNMAWTTGGDPDDVYCLLVGSGDYPVGTESDLDGVPYDIQRMNSLLTEDFGIPQQNVIQLVDARASRQNVIDGFRNHLAQAGPNGAVFFYYTGHGANVPSDVAVQDEEDGVDDAIALTDGQLLIDDEIAILIDELRAERRLVVFDACHSGTGSRLAANVRVRALDSELTSWLRAPSSFVSSRGSGSPSVQPGDHVFFGSSREIESSLDVSGYTPMGNPGGVFTWHFIEAVRALPPEATFGDIYDETVAQMQVLLDLLGEVQVPQLRGTRADETLAGFLSRPGS